MKIYLPAASFGFELPVKSFNAYLFFLSVLPVAATFTTGVFNFSEGSASAYNDVAASETPIPTNNAEPASTIREVLVVG